MKDDERNLREDSPDWLRSFQVPTHSALSISSDSEPSQNGNSFEKDTIGHGNKLLHETSQHSEDQKEDIILISEAQSPLKKNSKMKSVGKQLKSGNQMSIKRRKTTSPNKEQGDESKVILAKDETSKKHTKLHGSNYSVLSLSSDSESFQASSPLREYSILPEITSMRQESQIKKVQKCKDEVLTVEGNVDKVAGEETSEKHHACSTRLPLVLSEKVHRTKALVECEGESIDMSGDMGAVGRVVISNTPSGNHEMLLDLKGTIFRTTIVPSRTFCVVSFGQSEAKIEAIMNDFIQLKPQSNVFESETMIEGTLDGFSFDSEDETDKITKPTGMKTDEIEDDGKKSAKKSKGKAEKSGVRRGKTGGGKAPLKKSRKKPQVSKKAKKK